MTTQKKLEHFAPLRELIIFGTP